MATIKLEHIDKIYENGFKAVYDFNMEINEGEFIVFVGPSGCGKSTTLRMIAGLEDITEGTLYINDIKVNNIPPKERGVAMVFQSYALYPHLNVFSNMAFGLELEGYDQEFVTRRVKKTAQILGLSDYLERFPRELSGGQRQRVAVGRAIIRKPNVFLMDEPLSNLDAKQRVTMRAEIKDIHRKTGATSIYVTHDQAEAMTLADRIVVMRDGVIQQIGTPRELYFSPVNKFVAGFLGEPPMNFLDAEASQGFLKIKGTEVSLPLAKMGVDAVDGQYIFGFRPEAASLITDAPSQGGAVFSGEVELTELLGNTVNIYVIVGEVKLIIKCAPVDEPKAGTMVKFELPYKNISLFDATTQVALKKTK